jgi:hypothetical protein
MRKVSAAIVILLAIMFCASLAQEPDGNTYKNSAIGFEITKPDGWVFWSAAKVDSVIASSDKTAEQEEMLKYLTEPLVTIAKYQNPTKPFNPNLRVTVDSLGMLRYLDMVEMLKIISGSFAETYPDFESVIAPEEVEVSGIKSAHSVFNMSTTMPDSSSAVLTMEYWVVPRGAYYFAIMASSEKSDTTGAREKFQEIIKSVKISKE